MALILLLILAFAGPFVMRTSSVFGSGRKLLVLVVDNSFSMRAGDRLQQARQQALSMLGSLGDGDEGQVGALGARLDFLTLPTVDREELASAVRSIEASDARSSYGELARALRATAESARLPMEVHLFTDVQRTSMPSSFGDLALPADVRFEIHSVVDDTQPNFAIENVLVPAGIFNLDKSTVRATVAGYGTEPASETVSLLVNGQQVDSKTVDVPANGRATVEFRSPPFRYGFNRCEVRMEAGDVLPDDDHYLFATERADPRQILFVHRGHGTPRDLLYFQSALEASPNEAFRLQAVEAGSTSGVDPSRYALVVLSDTGALPGGFESKLTEYVREGGSLFIAAGPAMARLRTIPVMGLPVLDSLYASRSQQRFFVAGEADSSHPAVAVADLWEGVKFYQAARIDPQDSTVLARLANGVPLLVERPLGEGRTILFTSTFDNISNDLPLYPVFVAFVDRTTRYLGRVEERTSASAVGDFVDLRAGHSGEQAVGTQVIDPDGNRALSLEDATQSASFPAEKVGFYEIRRPGDRNEMVAVNADRREANLAVLPQETLDLWQTRDEGAQAAAAAGDAEQVHNRWRLGWFFLLMAFLVLLAESLVGAKYLSIDRGAA